MPSNQMDINIEIGTSQSDVQAIAKLTEALKAAGGTGGGGGGISKEFGTAAQGVSYLRENEAAQKAIGGKLSGASIRAEAGGGFTASAKIDEGQKKAFSPGGLIATIGTGVGAIGAGFKTLLGMSKIFQTFMGTTGKILATAVDLMLAPLMPFFMRIMVWLIQKIFPLAIKIGNFVGGLGDVGAGAALVGGFVALKFGPKLLTEAGKALGTALVNKMPYDTFGKNISAGISAAKDTLITWGKNVGGFIQTGMTTVAEKADMVTKWAKGVGGHIKEGLTAVSENVTKWAKGIGSSIQTGLTAVAQKADAVTTWAKGVGSSIQAGLIIAKDEVKKWAKGLGTFIKEGLTAVAEKADAVTTWAKGIGSSIQAGLIVAKDKVELWAKGVGSFIQEGLTTVAKKADAVTTWAKGVGSSIQAGLIVAKDAVTTWAKGIGSFIGTGLSGAKSLGQAWYSSIARGIGGALSSLTGWATTAGRNIAAGISGAPAWAKIGGIVALGIGAVALGAKIGFSMWKAYKEHEAGRDVVAGLDPLQLFTLFSQFGIDDPSSKELVTRIREADKDPLDEIRFLARDRGSIEAFAENYTNLMQAIEIFGTKEMSALTPYLKTFDKEVGRFVLEQIRDRELAELQGTEGFTGYLPQATAIANELERIRVEGESPAGRLYESITSDVSMQAVKEEATAGGGYLAEVGFYGLYQSFDEQGRQWEKALRKALEAAHPGEDYTKGIAPLGMGWFAGISSQMGYYSRELTNIEKRIGFAVMLAQNPTAAAMFISDPTRSEILGTEYPVERLQHYEVSLRLLIENDSLAFLSNEEKEAFWGILNVASASVGAVSNPSIR